MTHIAHHEGPKSTRNSKFQGDLYSRESEARRTGIESSTRFGDVHEASHAAISRDDKFRAEVDYHGQDFRLYAELTIDKTGLMISVEFTKAKLDLTLVHCKKAK